MTNQTPPKIPNGYQKNDIYLIGIHILFGLVLGTAFIEINDIIPIDFSFQELMLLVAISTIILSWIGYNYRISKFGHDSAKLFALDIIIISFYFHLVYSIEKTFNDFLFSFVLIFGAYLFWDLLKSKQDNIPFLTKNAKDVAKTVTEFSAFIIFLSIWIWYSFVNKIQLVHPYENIPSTELGFLVVTLVLIILFRIFEPPFNQYWPQLGKNK